MKDLYFVKTDENGYITYLTKTGTERDTIEFDFDETKNLSCYKVNDGVVSFDSEKEESINNINSLINEKAELESWLKNHDYIGTKIATGRATVEEYASEIAEMSEKASRINEIDRELSSIN